MATVERAAAHNDKGKALRIFVAIEPQSYSDVFSSALHVLLPAHDVRAAVPVDLDSEIARFTPHVVICSRLSEAVRVVARSWVLLYPDGHAHAVVSIDGREEEVVGIELSCLLAVIGAAERSLEATC